MLGKHRQCRLPFRFPDVGSALYFKWPLDPRTDENELILVRDFRPNAEGRWVSLQAQASKINPNSVPKFTSYE